MGCDPHWVKECPKGSRFFSWWLTAHVDGIQFGHGVDGSRLGNGINPHTGSPGADGQNESQAIIVINPV